jgi:hypothetical protein
MIRCEFPSVSYKGEYMSRKQVATLISFVFSINSTNDLTSASLNPFEMKKKNQIIKKYK